MYQRMGKDAEHTPLLARVDTQPAEVPIHARLQKFQQIEHEQQEAGKCGCQTDSLYILFYILHIKFPFCTLFIRFV